MSRRGFALLAVLWVITALTALTGAGLLVARIGSTTTRNRVLLARAEWAREACGEILLARFAADASVRALEPIDLGRGTWCRASIHDPSGKVNLNTADRDVLARLFAQVGVDVAIADSVVALRRSRTIYDVRQVPGLDSSMVTRLSAYVTTRGIGRRDARRLQSADELAGAVSRSSRTILLNSYAEFVRAAVFAPPQLIATVEGGVRSTAIVARATLTMVPVPGRLAIIRRETE